MPTPIRSIFRALFLTTLLSFHALAQTPGPHTRFRVTLAQSAEHPFSGRILVFLKPMPASGKPDPEVNSEEFAPAAVWVAAREVHDLAPGTSIVVDGANDPAFPSPFSNMPAGEYEAQAVLDTNHTYNYYGRTPEDWISPVVTVGTSSSDPDTLTLDHHPINEGPLRRAALETAKAKAAKSGAVEVGFESPTLTRFWGKRTQIKAWVILPPGYGEHPADRYPTVYWTHGFGGSLDGALMAGMDLYNRMNLGSMPPMIWVMLDESCPQGTHEFADSVNNGPWGTALTSEFIPQLEKQYRMDARPTGRFLNGHSSGGWATLQLQVNYPQIFGGTWSTSPDPSDFHNFTGPDLYAKDANVYHHPDGTPYPIMRDQGQVIATLQQFAQLEEVLGPYGGQMSSFDWVFSPRSPSGAPEPMFDRTTGQVNPTVVAYWRDHFDLANIVERTWLTRGPLLTGRIHLFVGTADTFYLDGSAHLFEARLQKLGADPHFTYIPNRTHFDLYNVGSDRNALFDQIAAEMYAIARPGATWKK